MCASLSKSVLVKKYSPSLFYTHYTSTTWTVTTHVFEKCMWQCSRLNKCKLCSIAVMEERHAAEHLLSLETVLTSFSTDCLSLFCLSNGVDGVSIHTRLVLSHCENCSGFSFCRKGQDRKQRWSILLRIWDICMYVGFEVLLDIRGEKTYLEKLNCIYNYSENIFAEGFLLQVEWQIFFIREHCNK